MIKSKSCRDEQPDDSCILGFSHGLFFIIAHVHFSMVLVASFSRVLATSFCLSVTKYTVQDGSSFASRRGTHPWSLCHMKGWQGKSRCSWQAPSRFSQRSGRCCAKSLHSRVNCCSTGTRYRTKILIYNTSNYARVNGVLAPSLCMLAECAPPH